MPDLAARSSQRTPSSAFCGTDLPSRKRVPISYSAAGWPLAAAVRSAAGSLSERLGRAASRAGAAAGSAGATLRLPIEPVISASACGAAAGACALGRSGTITPDGGAALKPFGDCGSAGAALGAICGAACGALAGLSPICGFDAWGFLRRFGEDRRRDIGAGMSAIEYHVVDQLAAGDDDDEGAGTDEQRAHALADRFCGLVVLQVGSDCRRNGGN